MTGNNRFKDSNDAPTDSPVRVGVIGVGSMGRNHARVYDTLQDVTLVGVSDRDEEVAREVADAFGTKAVSFSELLPSVDAVSVAVPTASHFDIVTECLNAGVDVLVEKPFVTEKSEGKELIRQANNQELILQVGHIERFNPAVQTVHNIVSEDQLISIEARRLGPPRDREIGDDVISDLMIHDIDIVSSLVDANLLTVSAHSPAAKDGGPLSDNKFTTATLQFTSGTVATLTASRTTRKTVRELMITTPEKVVEIDYIDQSVEIYRGSVPEYVETDDDVRYRHESVIEVPYVENAEPLKNELSAFLSSVKTRDSPQVTGTDGLRTIELTAMIRDDAMGNGS